MNAFKRNAVIAGCIVRMQCKLWDESKLEEALKASIVAHNIAPTERQYALLLGSAKRAFKGDWGKKVKQLEWKWGKSPLQDDQLRGAEVKA